MNDQDEWLEKAKKCPDNESKSHSYIPITWTKSDTSKHVKVLMCTLCFHEINISDCFRYRITP